MPALWVLVNLPEETRCVSRLTLVSCIPGLVQRRLIIQQGGAVDSIRPVTIKQLHGADHPHPDAKFYVDGFELAAVSRKVLNRIRKRL